MLQLPSPAVVLIAWFPAICCSCSTVHGGDVRLSSKVLSMTYDLEVLVLLAISTASLARSALCGEAILAGYLAAQETQSSLVVLTEGSTVIGRAGFRRERRNVTESLHRISGRSILMFMTCDLGRLSGGARGTIMTRDLDRKAARFSRL